MQQPDKLAIVRNVKTDDLYRYEGDNVFTNLRTLKSGKVDDEAARIIFKINVEMTMLLNDHPHITQLINKLNLKYDFKQSKIE